jgi:hypothetical protein
MIADIKAYLYGAPTRFVTANGTFRFTRDPLLATAVFERWLQREHADAPSGSVAIIHPSDVPSRGNASNKVAYDDVWEGSGRVWVRPPDESRVEARVGNVGPTLMVVGHQGWVHRWPNGPTTSETFTSDREGRRDQDWVDSRHPEEALALLAPAELTRGYALTVLGDTVAAGRPVLRVDGQPIHGGKAQEDPDNRRGLFSDADRIQLLVDRERGVLLRWAGLVDGAEYAATEFTEIVFDTNLEEALFDPTLVT